MSSLRYVSIIGISASSGKIIKENSAFEILSEEERTKTIKTTGIERRRHVDENVTTVDLCEAAGRQLLQEAGIKPEEIQAAFLVTQTPDYLYMPASAPLLQHRLGLSKNAACFDITLGCSGYTYGLRTIASFMSANQIKYGLLFVGDTTSRRLSERDKSTYPIFGDAASATLLRLEEPGLGSEMWSDFGTDGSGANAIIIPEGGSRSPFTAKSLVPQLFEEGIERAGIHLKMDGHEVFNFCVRQVPQTVGAVLAKSGANIDEIDIFAFHQANLLIIDLIRKRLKIPIEKLPLSLKDFGNTNSASIPVTLVTQRAKELQSKRQKILACGFGVGLSWCSLVFETDRIACPPLLEI